MEETQSADIFQGRPFLIDTVINAHIVLQLPREGFKCLAVHPQREQVHGEPAEIVEVGVQHVDD